jgi:hypothetical protein
LLKNRLRELEHEIYEIQSIHPNVKDHAKEVALLAEYEEVDLLRETKWHQRSKLRWATVGDKNTKFFHTAATLRWRKNLITTLQRENDTWTEEESQIKGLLVEYFKEIYLEQSGQNETRRLLEAYAPLLPMISPTTHYSLTRIPSAAEIFSILSSIGLDTAPGSDGITARLLKKIGHFRP